MCLSPHRRQARSGFTLAELLVSIGWDGVGRLWNAETGRQLLSSPAAETPLRFSRDGRRFAWGLRFFAEHAVSLHHLHLALGRDVRVDAEGVGLNPIAVR